MRFTVLSRAAAERLEPPGVPYAVVAIGTPGGVESTLPEHPGRLGLHRAAFHDVDEPRRSAAGVDLAPITDEQAAGILCFARSVTDRGAELIVCHCDAGISRSAGCAAGLAVALGLDDREFFLPSGPYSPNLAVYRSILRAAGMWWRWGGGDG